MVSGMSDVGIPDDIRDFVTQASTGLLQLIDSEGLRLTENGEAAGDGCREHRSL